MSNGFDEFVVTPQTDPSEGNHVMSLKLTNSLVNNLKRNPHQITLRFTSNNSAVFTGPDFEQTVQFSRCGEKTKPFECYRKEGNNYIQVGTISKKGNSIRDQVDAKLEDELIRIRDDEERKKEFQKVTALQTGRKRARPITTRKTPIPKRVARSKSPTNHPKTKLVSVPIEEVRVSLIKLLAQKKTSEQDIFKQNSYSAADTLKVLNDIGMREGNLWKLDVEKLGETDFSDKLSPEDEKNIERLMVEAEKEKIEANRKTQMAIAAQSAAPPVDVPVKEKSPPRRTTAAKAPKVSSVAMKAPKTSRTAAKAPATVIPNEKIPKRRKSSSSRSRTPSRSSEASSSRAETPKRKESRSSTQTSLKDTIRSYEAKKEEFNKEHSHYKKLFDSLEANGRRVQDLESKWKNARDSKDKEHWAEEIQEFHHRKKKEVHDAARKCATLAEKLKGLRSDLENLSDRIKSDYAKLV